MEQPGEFTEEPQVFRMRAGGTDHDKKEAHRLFIHRVKSGTLA